MPQEQLCRCGQRAGTNSDCEICCFISTETHLRDELKDFRARLETLEQAAALNGIYGGPTQ